MLDEIFNKILIETEKQVKVVPIGQIIMLAILVFVIGIGITIFLKKKRNTQDVRKTIVFYSFAFSLLIIILGLISIGINPVTWSLYPWKFETLKAIMYVALLQLTALVMAIGITMVVVAGVIVLLLLTFLLFFAKDVVHYCYEWLTK